MPILRRDVRFGRIALVTFEGELSQTVGDTLAVVGGGVIPGERRARPFNLVLPIRGDTSDPNPYAAGEKLRRQVRSLIENPRVRLEGVYVRFFIDPEQNGWLVVGGGDLKYAEGGISLADFQLALTDAFRVGSLWTHKPARRLEKYDRWLATTPRDYMGTIYLTDFSDITPITSLHFVPPSFGTVETVHRAVLRPDNLATMGGNLGVLYDRAHGEVAMFEMAEDSVYSGADVVCFDRREIRSPTETVRTNQVTNPSFETATTGWTAANATIARVGMLRPFGKYAGRSTRTAAGGSTEIASYAITLASSAETTVSMYVYIPSAWDGTSLTLSAENFASATGTTITNASLGTRDTWQRLSFTFDPSAGDVVGNIILSALGSGTGSVLYLDGLMVETASTLNEYFDGDGEWADWTGTAHASTSRWYGDPEDYGWEEVYGPDYPFTASDTPLMQNGIVRVRHSTGSIWKCDSFSAGFGWLEMGAFHFYRVTASGATRTRYDTLSSARVAEWTPERAVVAITVSIAAEPGEHAHAYITLQRGWMGPRIEAYGMSSTVMPGVEIVWEQRDADGGLVVAWGKLDNDGTAKAYGSDEPGATWNNVSRHTWAAGQHPWVMAVPDSGSATADRVTAIGVMRYGVRLYTFDSTVAYGTTYKAIAIRSQDGTAQEGYVSAHLGLTANGRLEEAESWVNAGGTRSLVADANAYPGSGNSAVADTQTSEAAPTIRISSGVLDGMNVTAGSWFAVWARVRAVDAASTVAARFRFGAAVEAAAVTATATTTSYVWLWLGTEQRASGELFDLSIWRSAGTGAVRIDRLMIVPAWRRSLAGGSSLGGDGFYDWAYAHRYDSRQIPTIVSR